MSSKATAQKITPSSPVELSPELEEIFCESTVGVADRLEPSHVLQMYLRNHVHHVVQRSNGNFDEELNIARALIQEPDHFMAHPVEAILPHFKGNPLFVPVFSSKSKGAFLQSLEKELTRVPGSKSVIKSLLTIGDEFYTNIIFNAPTTTNGVHKYKEHNRDTVVKLGLEEQGKIFLGFTEDEIVIGSQDPFGSLDPDKVLSGMLRCYESGTYDSMNRGPGGAGIGFQMVFEQCSTLLIGVHKNRSTVVCVKLPLGLGMRGRDEAGKNLHVIKRGFIKGSSHKIVK